VTCLKQATELESALGGDFWNFFLLCLAKESILKCSCITQQ